VKGLRRFTDWPLRAKLTALLVAAALLPLIVSTAIDIRDARHRLVTLAAALLAARGDQLSGARIGTLSAGLTAFVIDSRTGSRVAICRCRVPGLCSMSASIYLMTAR
jgi:hypothetical protein